VGQHPLRFGLFDHGRSSPSQLRKTVLKSTGFPFFAQGAIGKRFQAKWVPVRVKKTRQNKNLEPRSDEIGTEWALTLEFGRGGLYGRAGF
jgi:hypothetical protein